MKENSPTAGGSLRRFMFLSVAASVATITLKSTAYLLTDSVGLLSDALESVVNLVAALFTLRMVTLALRPPDDEHVYGHTKAEYFAGGVEGALVLIAAATIGYSAVARLLHPQPLEQIGLGVLVSVMASLINFAVAKILDHAAQQYRSTALRADARHLMTDVWTTTGVLVGIGAVAWTGWQWLDPLIALGVACNILRAGVRLMREAAMGLLDTGLPLEERAQIYQILDSFAHRGVNYHSLRTRQAGIRRFISVHILVPGAWTVQRGHDLLEEIEEAIRTALPGTTVFTHLEPVEDPLSMEDKELDRLEV